MNKELKCLYEKYWNNLLANAQGTKAAHPLLLMVNNDYIKSDVKVMIIGQETDKMAWPFRRRTKKYRLFNGRLLSLSLQYSC